VKAAAVSVDEAPRRIRDELAQRRHPVLQGHSDTVDGAGSCHHRLVSPNEQRDLEQLLDLNRDYIDSVQRGDVGRFDEILDDDFVCSNPDGSIVDRNGFLEQTAEPVTISNLAAHDVDVRLFGDVAIIHARTTYMLPDGRQGAGRYTDVWARHTGRWLAVAAHVTRGSGA
jgi:ketosteroid isomerase-like protein